MTDSGACPSNPPSKNRITVFHDGGCPLCRLEIRAMRRLDSDNNIAFVDITKDQRALEDTGITFEQAMNRFHVSDDSLGVQTGVQGFLCVWNQLPYLRPMVPVISRIPGLLPILDVLYRVFAKYRLVLTGRQQALERITKNDRDQQ